MNFATSPLRVLLKHGRGRITSPIVHLLINPLQAQFIISYPRSGSTWLRTMLTSVLYSDFRGDPAIFNRVIPGSTLTRLGFAYKAPTPRIFSTHSTYRNTIRRAVYLMRDGRNSVSSFYRYTTTRVGINMKFSRWFAFYVRGFYGARWDQHVVSWCTKGQNHMRDNLLTVQYEDFLANPVVQLEKVCEFFGIPFNEEDLIRAVKISSVANMRKWERHYLGEIKDPNASFYRGGKVKEWKSLFNEMQKKKFLELSKKALTLGGYV